MRLEIYDKIVDEFYHKYGCCIYNRSEKPSTVYQIVEVGILDSSCTLILKSKYCGFIIKKSDYQNFLLELKALLLLNNVPNVTAYVFQNELRDSNDYLTINHCLTDKNEEDDEELLESPVEYRAYKFKSNKPLFKLVDKFEYCEEPHILKLT